MEDMLEPTLIVGDALLQISLVLFQVSLFEYENKLSIYLEVGIFGGWGDCWVTYKYRQYGQEMEINSLEFY